MPESPRSIDVLDLEGPEQFLAEVVQPCLPVVLRGLVRNWPIVAAGRLSPSAVRDHLKPLDAGDPRNQNVAIRHASPPGILR
ncbi:MAG: hypothetical protein ABI145_13580 [Steroidobacteraceae bacterium]